MPSFNVRSWRTSNTVVVFTATLGLFSENFLYSAVVPLLPYMIERRLGLDKSFTQKLTTELLFIMGLVSVPAAPIIGHFADKTRRKKVPLLFALTGCSIGTLLVALTPSVWAVYAGRILQGTFGTAVWILCYSMLSDVAGSRHLGKALGSAGSFTTAGTITGPAISGVLLQYGGYWPAWSVPIGLLAIGFVARVATIEQSVPETTDNAAARFRESDPLLNADPDADERAPLESDEFKEQQPTQGFYRVMLSRGAVYAAIFNVIAVSMLISGFDATLPIHLRDTFGWGSASIGSIFLGLQVPGMCLAPFVGWLRDRIGLRWPTTIGWALTAPLLWFAGVPGGNHDYFGIGSGARGQGSFVACVIAIGIVAAFVRGAGTFQLTTIMHDLREEDPNIFGPGGGSSRTFSLTGMSYNIGLMLGPLVCGSLSGAVGFYYTTCALAAVSAAVAISSLVFFTHKPPEQEVVEEEQQPTPR